MGTGFLGFKEKGNYEPPTKEAGMKTKAKPRPNLRPKKSDAY